MTSIGNEKSIDSSGIDENVLGIALKSIFTVSLITSRPRLLLKAIFISMDQLVRVPTASNFLRDAPVSNLKKAPKQ